MDAQFSTLIMFFAVQRHAKGLMLQTEQKNGLLVQLLQLFPLTDEYFLVST